jgi:uncharacterized membrane protein YfcA
MEVALGFVIAFVIAITGVGAGTITAPLLILALHVPVAISVGTALAYSTIVKAIVVPVQIVRKQVAWRVLGIMLLGGLPGVIVGCLLFRRYAAVGGHAIFYAVLGLIIVFSAAWHLYRHFRPHAFSGDKPTRRGAIAALMFPIAAEVGFASSGAGAMGTLVLMGLSSLDAAKVVGTDLVFAFCMTLTGTGLHLFGGHFDNGLLIRLVIGGVLGASAGSFVAPRVPSRQLRLALSLCLVLLGLSFCYRAFSMNAVGIRTSLSEAAAQVRSASSR